MVTHKEGLKAARALFAVAAAIGFIAALSFASPAAAQPTSNGHANSTTHEGVTTHNATQTEWTSRQAPPVLQACQGTAPLGYDPSADLMDPVGSPYPLNSVGARYAVGGPSLMSWFGYGNANLLSWWTNPYGPFTTTLNPAATSCAGAPGVLPY